VTGGSKGFGLSTAEALAAAGAKVAVLGRKRADLDTATEKLRSLGAADVLAIQGDVTDIAACERTIAGVIERFGSLDMLVNNAGGASMVFRQAAEGRFPWFRVLLEGSVSEHGEEPRLSGGVRGRLRAWLWCLPSARLRS